MIRQKWGLHGDVPQVSKIVGKSGINVETKLKLGGRRFYTNIGKYLL